MSDIWFSSDLHLGHKKIQQFCPNTRKGETVEEMDELIIQKHNELVKPDDIWWHLGDFSFASSGRIIDYLGRMNGKKHFIWGNHDESLEKHASTRIFMASYSKYEFIKIGKQKLALFHFPIEEWQEKHHGSIHLHGHVHGQTSNGRTQPLKNRLDVGIDNRKQCDMAPFNYDEILEILKCQNDEIDEMANIRKDIDDRLREYRNAQPK